MMDVDNSDNALALVVFESKTGDTTPPPSRPPVRRALTEKELLALKDKV
jgi:hypothetical protein